MQERLSVRIEPTPLPGLYSLSLKKDGPATFRSIVWFENWYCFGRNWAEAKAKRIIKRRARVEIDGSWVVTLDRNDSELA